MNYEIPTSIYVVCGSREWPERLMWFVTAKMIELIPRGATVRTGGARGVDRHAHLEAVRLHYRTEVFKADWEGYGKAAGFIRNTDMLKQVHPGTTLSVLAFQWADSRGTAHTIREAARLGRLCHAFTEADTQPDVPALGVTYEDHWRAVAEAAVRATAEDLARQAEPSSPPCRLPGCQEPARTSTGFSSEYCEERYFDMARDAEEEQ